MPPSITSRTPDALGLQWEMQQNETLLEYSSPRPSINTLSWPFYHLSVWQERTRVSYHTSQWQVFFFFSKAFEPLCRNRKACWKYLSACICYYRDDSGLIRSTHQSVFKYSTVTNGCLHVTRTPWDSKHGIQHTTHRQLVTGWEEESRQRRKVKGISDITYYIALMPLRVRY